MNEPSIKRSFVFNIFNQCISLIIPFLITRHVARIFEAYGIGLDGVITTNVTYFTLFSMLGIAGYGQREIAISRNNRKEMSLIFCELQFIHFLTFLFSSFLYLILILKSKQYSIYYIAYFTTLIGNLFDISWFYQAVENFKLISIKNSAIKLLTIILVFLFINSKNDLVLYMALISGMFLLSNLSLWIGIRKHIDFYHLRFLNLTRHIKQIIIFFIPLFAGSVYSLLNKSVINWITHEEVENGYYELAYKILGYANLFVQTLASVSAPRMSNLFSLGDLESIKNRLNLSLKYMFFIALPTSFGVASVIDRLIPFMYGHNYEKVQIIVYIFMPLIVIISLSVYLDAMYLVPSGKRLYSAFAICCGSVINVFLNAFLVYKFKSVGAAIATFLTESFISLIIFNLSKKMINIKEILNSFTKYGICSIIMFFLVRMIGLLNYKNSIILFVQIASGAFFYVFFLIILKDEIVLLLIDKIRKTFISIIKTKRF